MRNKLVLWAALAGGLALVHAGQAQYTMPATTTVVGGGAGRTGGFVGGFTPTNIVNKPINAGGAAKPINLTQAAMPQQQSTKVFNINSAFSKIQTPLFRSQAPNVPIVTPGKGNPIQPVATPKVKSPISAQQVEQRKLLGIIPW